MEDAIDDDLDAPEGSPRRDIGRREVATPREHAEVPPALHDLLEAGVGDRPRLEVREEWAWVDHDLRPGHDDFVVAGDGHHREQLELVHRRYRLDRHGLQTVS